MTRAPRAADVAFGLGLLVGVAVNLVVGAPARHEAVIGYADFSYVWAGPRTILDGGDPYDPAQWSASVRRLGTEPYDDPAVYSYPPYVALELLPLGAMPLAVADGIWLWGGLAAAAVSVLLLLRTYAVRSPAVAFVAALVLLVSQPSVFAFYGGQWSFVLVAALAVLGIAAERRRALGGGVGAVVLLAKPQIGVVILGGIAWRALRRGDRRVTRAVVAAAAAVVGLSAVAVPGWWLGWLEHVPLTRAGEPSLATLPSAVGVPAAVIGIGIAAVIAIRADVRSPVSAALWMTLGVVAAPYARSYEQLLLVVPCVIACAGLSPRAGWAMGIAIATVLIVLPWSIFVAISPVLGSERMSALVAVAAFALIAVRSRTPAATAPSSRR